MTRVFAILLLIVLLIPLAGGHLLFKLRQWQIKEQIEERMKQGIPQEDLVLVQIPKAWEENGHPGFQWIEENEFRYNKQMYDIVESEERGDTTYYYCIQDDRETALYKELAKRTKSKMNHDPTSQQQREHLTKLLTHLYFAAKPLQPSFQPISSEAQSKYNFICKTWQEAPPSPPPCIPDFT